TATPSGGGVTETFGARERRQLVIGSLGRQWSSQHQRGSEQQTCQHPAPCPQRPNQMIRALTRGSSHDLSPVVSSFADHIVGKRFPARRYQPWKQPVNVLAASYRET